MIILIIGFRWWQIKVGKVEVHNFDHNHRLRDNATQGVDSLAYILAEIPKEIVWQAYVYLVKIIREIVKLSRRYLHIIEDIFTDLSHGADRKIEARKNFKSEENSD